MNKTEINILFFGVLKRFFGESILLSVENKSSIETVINMLIELNPEAADFLKSCQFAVNSNIIDAKYVITEKCELALLPPFSGG